MYHSWAKLIWKSVPLILTKVFCMSMSISLQRNISALEYRSPLVELSALLSRRSGALTRVLQNKPWLLFYSYHFLLYYRACYLECSIFLCWKWSDRSCSYFPLLENAGQSSFLFQFAELRVASPFKLNSYSTLKGQYRDLIFLSISLYPRYRIRIFLSNFGSFSIFGECAKVCQQLMRTL